METRNKKFENQLNSFDDALQIIIRGHLYVGAEIDDLITEQLPQPEYLDLDSFNFPKKIDLLIDLGLLPPEDKGGYLSLNRLRNKIAHDLDYIITEDQVNKLYQSLSQNLQHPFHKKGQDHLENLRVTLCVLYVRIQAIRERVIENKKHMEELIKKADALRKRSEMRQLTK
jgi:hypothetical protein